jgi:transposase
VFIRRKQSGRHEYLQVVHNERVEGRVRQRVIATLGRREELEARGQIDGLLVSLGRYAEHAAVLGAHRSGEGEGAESRRIGAPLVFERLWRECGVMEVLEAQLERRRFQFSVERAVFLTVLHRLMDPGSDRAAEVWCRRYRIEGTEEVELHHLYRAMAWLGQRLRGQRRGKDAAGEGLRTVKDRIEEALFARRRDLFSTLDLVFFDTTSLYFEGAGGESLGQYGHSKDHRPDRRQIVVGAVLDNRGQPICSEVWPGNRADVKTLLPVVDRLKQRFGIGTLSIVADRGMVSRGTVEALRSEDRQVHYILGARLRSVKEVREEVLSRPGRYRVVHGPRESAKDPSPLQVKDVRVGGRRYVVCLNEEQARKDRADREAILAALESQLRAGDKALVGNHGYRKYLKASGRRFEIDYAKVEAEARYDGKWVLETDLEIDAAEVALKYKELWQVEAVFRSVKSVLDTRPIYHRRDATIRGHVFCSFLALVLLKELQRRMQARGWRAEWERLKDDLDALEEFTVQSTAGRFVIRSQTLGDAGRALQAAGVALGRAIRRVESTAEEVQAKA